MLGTLAILGIGLLAGTMISKYFKHIINFVRQVADTLAARGIISEGFQSFIHKAANTFYSLAVHFYQDANDNWRKRVEEVPVDESEVPDDIKNMAANRKKETTQDVEREMLELQR